MFRNIDGKTTLLELEMMRSDVYDEIVCTAAPGDNVRMTDVRFCRSVQEFSSEQFDLDEFSAKENIETSIEWFELLQNHVYAGDHGVRYYFISNNGVSSTILPLRLTTKGRVRTVEALGNYYTSLYSPLLTGEGPPLGIRQILASATRERGGAHVVRFAPMDPESSSYKVLVGELRALGWRTFDFFCFGNWYLKVDFDWDGYLKKRSANLRSTIKRMTKKLIADGGKLEVITSKDRVDHAISAFHEVYLGSWKIPEPYPDFVPSLIRLLASKGMLRLGVAYLQGRPIAAQLWIVGKGKASIYKVAYHESFSAYSPGTVLTSHLLQHVIAQDHVREVDFLIGDDKYKQIWMSDRRERRGIIAYNPRTIIGLALLLKEASGRLAKPVTTKIKSIFLRTKLHFSTPKKISSDM